MRRSSPSLIALAATLAFATPAGAVTLVTPQGTPVGGKWQRWADQARVPTFHGRLTFTTSESMCSGDPSIIVRGCSAGPPRYGPAYLLNIDPRADALSLRETFYEELGHVYDWQNLTDRTRHHLARLWGHSRWPWWDTAISVGADGGHENGLEIVFTWVYAACARGDYGVTSLDALTPEAPSVSFERTDLDTTCRFIKRVAAR